SQLTNESVSLPKSSANSVAAFSLSRIRRFRDRLRKGELAVPSAHNPGVVPLRGTLVWEAANDAAVQIDRFIAKVPGLRWQMWHAILKLQKG
ncbi:hypothetical protein, partial [Caulobacter sp. S45]|uniref:hypothetical protein n=1 Tax=Caulobacter sp. S45 TaxID=1641861 RepID=UPI001C2DCAA3